MDIRSIMDMIIPAASAHEKWFVPTYPVTYPVPEFYRELNLWTVGAVVFVLAISIAGYFADRWYEKSSIYERFETKVRKFRDYAAGALAITTGIALIWMSYKGQLLAPNYPLAEGLPGMVLRMAEGAIGALLLIGLYTPVAAMGLAGLFVAALMIHGPIEALDYVNFLGIAIFLLAFSRGRYSLDWFLGKPLFSTPQHRKYAYVALRVLTGLAIFWVGLLKWRRPDLHLSLMDQFAAFNPYVILGWVGIHMSREVYIFILFVVEALIGVFEMLGFLTRVTAVLLAPVFLISLVFLGPLELFGHLPILGTVIVFFIYGDTYYKYREKGKGNVHPHPVVQQKNAPQ